jgi:hypothetical protein
VNRLQDNVILLEACAALAEGCLHVWKRHRTVSYYSDVQTEVVGEQVVVCAWLPVRVKNLATVPRQSLEPSWPTWAFLPPDLVGKQQEHFVSVVEPRLRPSAASVWASHVRVVLSTDGVER